MVPSDLVVGERRPRDRPYGWVQAHGFFEHDARVWQCGQVFDRRCTTSKAGSQFSQKPVLNVRMTRNMDQVSRGLEKFLGRKYDYTPENDLERQYTYYPVETQEQIRVRVALSAIQGLIVHMGTLKEGRKSLIVVSEGWSNRLPGVVQAQNPTVGGGGVPLGPGGNGIIDPIGAAGLSGAQADFAATMDTLVSLGTLAAWGWSAVVLVAGLNADVYFEVAGVTTTLILLGRFLEARARRRSGAAIRAKEFY